MIRTYEISDTPLPRYEPGTKLPVGPTPRYDPDGRLLVAEWLGHLEAGRIGGSLCGPTGSASGCASQPLLEARNPPMSDERKAEILANEQVLRGVLGRRG